VIAQIALSELQQLQELQLKTAHMKPSIIGIWPCCHNICLLALQGAIMFAQETRSNDNPAALQTLQLLLVLHVCLSTTPYA
jgi:hypothetical protein